MRYHPRMLSGRQASAPRILRTLLLWLVVVMALAQTIAISHVYTHTPGEASTQTGGKHPGGLAHCDACIAAVALGAGAPPAVPLVVAASAQQLPLPTASAVRSLAPHQRPYAIRAPPSIAS